MSSDPFAADLDLEGIPSTCASTRDSIDSVLRDRGLRRSTPEQTARSLLLGAAATRAIEGSQITADELAAGEGDPLDRAAVRLYGELVGLIPTWTTSPLQAIARLHVLATSGVVEADSAGRPATPEAAQLLAGLARYLVAPTEAPAVLVASCVHATIGTSGAFGDHDGVVARAAERLVLVSRGIDPAAVTVPEAGHAMAPRQAYDRLLHGFRDGGDVGRLEWHVFAFDAYGAGAAASPLVA